MRSLQCCALIILVLAGSMALSQTSPDLEQGMKPYGSYHGGNLDHNSLTNGNLLFQADLMAYSQRGGELAYPIVLRYNNKAFSIFEQSCGGTKGCVPQFTVLFGPNPLRTFKRSLGNSVTIGYEGLPGMGYGFVDTSVAFDGNEIYVKPPSVLMPDGSTHQLATSTNGLVTMDGSGYSAASSTGPVIGRDGTQYAFTGAAAEDRNGNLITSSSSSWIDTLNRQIPPAPFGSGIPLGSPPTNTVSLSACPTLNYTNQAVTYAYTWNLPTVGGGTLPLVLCFSNVWVRTNVFGSTFSNGPHDFDVNKAFTMLQSVVFPDNTYWAFQYDAADPNNTSSIAFGDLLKVTFPSGGSLTYTWETWPGCASYYTSPGPGQFSRAVLTRTVDAADGTGPHTWNYSYSLPVGTSSSLTGQTVVTDPLRNDTVHGITGLGATCSLYETQTQYYQGSHSSGTLLKTETTDYQYTVNPYDPLAIGNNGGDSFADSVANVFPIRVTTTLPNGLMKKEETDYDNALAYHGPVDGITWNVNTCAGTGDPPCWGDQQTNPVTNYTGSYGKVIAQREYDWGQGAPGALLRQTKTSYLWQSNGSYLSANLLDLPSSVVIQDGNGNRVAETDYTYDESQYLSASNISTQHGAAPNAVRGNLTTVSKWLNTSSNPVVTHTNWYDTGEAYQAIDPLGNTTTHSYSSSFAGAYPTQTCNALSQCVSGNYDFDTGLLTSLTDANSQTSTYNYDSRWRITEALFPADPAGNHPETDFSYPTLTEVDRSSTVTTGPRNLTSQFFDGLGRPVKLVHTSANNATVVTNYDADGRVASVTNPYYPGDTVYSTSTAYDGLGRVTQTTKQDGSITSAQYDQTSSTSPNGDCTLSTDEAGKQRKSCLDGLGRLIEVDEPQPSSGSMSNPYVTLYSYDTLGNLLSVNQKGDGSAPRVRTFTYDSLSRLLTATNPESGQISYSYDANGNVLQKTSPAPNQTGSATQTISYCYDKLNRVTGKAYSAQSCPLSSPVVTYSYDSGTNGIGHLTSLSDQAGSGSYSFDALGRIGTEQRTIAGIQKSLSYTYNLDGSVATLTYPSGAVVTYTPDSAGRMLSAADVANNINYVTGATYGPDNSVTGFLGGQSTSFAGISNSFSYNPRLQPITMAATAPDCTGSGCSASVSISGSLGTAASTTGTPPPSASPGSALSGYEDSAGLNHWLYEGTNDHLYEVYWNNNGSGRGYADATVETGGPLAAQTTALSTYLDNSQVPHWIYEDGAQHMQLFWIFSGMWGSLDNTVFVGSPVMATGTALTSKEDTNCMQHWAFFGSNKDLYEMHHDAVNGCLGAGVSGYSDGTATTGAPAAAPGSAMSMYFDNSQVAHWIYEDSNQHIQLLWWLSSGSWGNIDVTTTTGGPVAAPGSALTSREDTNCLQHWAYFGTNQHLYDAYHDDSSGCTGTPVSGYSDGTAATGAPAAAPGSALSMYFDNSQVAHWIYEDSSQHIQLLWYAGGSWGHLDVTATAGSPLAAPGSALASGEDTNCLQRWLYFGSNQHLYEVHVQGNAGGGCSGSGVWGYSDVTVATPSEVIDSGTVSLTVGSFTATACFGSSSNPACTGKPVNDSPSQVASALATALNASGSPVTATASGATINMTWKASGAATPVSPLSTTHDNPSLFPGPSFTSGAASFGGGTGGTLPVFSLTYNFNLGNGNNGNVIGITNNRDTTRSQSFTYDYLNRLTSAQNAGTNCNQMTVNGKTEYWGNSYGYDAWGNLLQKTPTKCSAENLSVTALSNNQLSGYGYDAAGNMTHDSSTNVNYTFDAENRITGAAGYTYTYDADSNRVEKSNGSTGTIYWYMTPGIVAESDLSGNLKSEYVFFDGERVARKDFPGNAVSYYFSDHLKTASVITNSAGVITEDEDYYPWGGELQFVNSDSNHYKFIGKERDSETGLDYFGARYYGNWYGRFLSADWSAKPEAVPYSDLHDPQSLNLYSYVRNVPTSKADPDGHDGWGDFESASIVLIDHLTAKALTAFGHWLTSGPPPHEGPAPPPIWNPMLPGGCGCPQSTTNQNNDSKQNSNNSQSQNTGEQGRDAQGRFVSKQPGQAQPGSGAEKKGLDSVGAAKNNNEILNGTKRDGTIPETGQHVEVKSGASVSNTEQLQNMGQAAVDATGKPLKVVTTNPNVKVTKPARQNENLEFEHKPKN